MKDVTPLLLILLLVAAMYVLPNALAMFAGSHTMEANASAYFHPENLKSLDCLKCHQYILDELQYQSSEINPQYVLAAHRRAAGNGSDFGNYTTWWLSMELNNDTNNPVSLCQMCHLAKINPEYASGDKLSPAHTQTTIRMCTDIDCHGNNKTTRSYYSIGNVGVNLGQVNNSHRRWFTELSAIQTSYVNETGTAYTKDYWACLGCHTEVGMKVTFKNREAETFNHHDPKEENETRRYL